LSPGLSLGGLSMFLAASCVAGDRIVRMSHK
jgi:hypothetical protein